MVTARQAGLDGVALRAAYGKRQEALASEAPARLGGKPGGGDPWGSSTSADSGSRRGSSASAAEGPTAVAALPAAPHGGRELVGGLRAGLGLTRRPPEEGARRPSAALFRGHRAPTAQAPQHDASLVLAVPAAPGPAPQGAPAAQETGGWQLCARTSAAGGSGPWSQDPRPPLPRPPSAAAPLPRRAPPPPALGRSLPAVSQVCRQVTDTGRSAGLTAAHASFVRGRGRQFSVRRSRVAAATVPSWDLAPPRLGRAGTTHLLMGHAQKSCRLNAISAGTETCSPTTGRVLHAADYERP